MMEEQAVVVEVGDGRVWVETQRQSACAGCSAKTGCGTAALSQLWGQRRTRTPALSMLPLQVGDTVSVAVAEGAVLRGAWVIYFLPIALLLAGALLGQAVFGQAGEEPVVLAGGVGLGLGLLAARALSGRWCGDARFQAVVLRRLATASDTPTLLSSSH
ncbi:MAG: SoxR reducing system RseC family protein [Candidatus Contendobacter sp.]